MLRRKGAGNVKKKALFVIGIFVLLALAGLIYFSVQQNVLNGTGVGKDVDSTHVSLIADTPEYTEYQINWVYYGSNHNACSSIKTLNLDYSSPYAPANQNTEARLSSNIVIPQTQFAELVDLSNIQMRGNPCGDVRKSGKIRIINKDITAKCTLSKGMYNSRLGTNAKIVCRIKGPIEGERAGLFYGDLSGNAIIKFYKKGYERQTYYRLNNNNCAKVTISQKDKTLNDYSSLEKCQLHIIVTNLTNNTPGTNDNLTDGGLVSITKEKTNYLLYVGIFLLLIFISIVIYVKKKH